MQTFVRTGLAAACAALVSYVPAAQALTLVSIRTSGNSIQTEFSTPELVAADIGFESASAVTLTFRTDAEDVARGSARFNSILDNFSATPFVRLTVEVDAGTLVTGSFASNEGDMGQVVQGERSVSFAFPPQWQTQVYLGDPLFSGTAIDWTWNLDDVGADTLVSLTVTAAVPEPGSLAMLASGCLALGLALRRRRSPRWPKFSLPRAATRHGFRESWWTGVRAVIRSGIR